MCIRDRAIYNGLKGHTNRENLLEEFLVALQVKEPVVIEAADRDRSYRMPATSVVDTIEIRKNTWGYVNAVSYTHLKTELQALP